MSGNPATSIRIDKWLWHARFFKTRTLASSVVAQGKVRVDSVPVTKPSRLVSIGNVLTFAREGEVKVVKVLAVGLRRGPATEAATLYEDLSPPPADRPPVNPAFDGGGRPGKRERRNRAAFDELG